VAAVSKYAITCKVEEIKQKKKRMENQACQPRCPNSVGILQYSAQEMKLATRYGGG
jgi:hypothetical protein